MSNNPGGCSAPPFSGASVIRATSVPPVVAATTNAAKPRSTPTQLPPSAVFQVLPRSHCRATPAASEDVVASTAFGLLGPGIEIAAILETISGIAHEFSGAA
ncbi:hypothetical protein [Mycolicibacter terrae]|uniref:hypothetical protein n=1 Tax=Mycolicibacter terrae TaxID=1788 RepID=UPI000F64A164|nr:hypothetical protein [Mycolicibacter terrae]